MLVSTQAQPNPSSNSNRGRKNRGGRRKGHREPDTSNASSPSAEIIHGSLTVPSAESEEGAVCWICAEPIKFYSLSECNHRTCHICALRLRALYKRMDCTFCKHPQVMLIFTRCPDDLFESYTPERIPFKDMKLSICFETQDMMEETLILLRFNCPDPSCHFIAHGWGDLKMHIKATHNRSMCELCIRYKKVFAHEHVLYQPSQLPFHLPSIASRPSQRSQTNDTVEGGEHPMCKFCRECHFGDDELFAHMRERHEECFLCKREGIRDQYFQNYNTLERHFDIAHFPCKDSQCQLQKFVVFGSALDLKAHMVEQHGGDMKARDKKDARRIETGFDFDDATGSGGGNRRQGQNRERDRDREPPEPGSSRNRRREGFGATLTSEPLRLVSSPQPLQSRPRQDDHIIPSSSAEVDPVTVERHEAFIARVNLLTSNSTTAVPAIKSAVRSYRSSESGPRDLLSTFFNVVNRDLDATASLISALVELLDDEEKRRALLACWNGFKLEQQRQFPDLTPAAPGSEYAGVAGGRVLNVKHPAAVRTPSTQSPRQVWDRVAQAAASSSLPSPPGPMFRPQDRFPSLAASRTTPLFRQAQHNTAWSVTGASSSSAPSRPPLVTSGSHLGSTPVRTQGSAPRNVPPKLSASLFPTLPSVGGNNTSSRPVVSGNQSLKHILGEAHSPPSNPWGVKKGEEPGTAPTRGETDSLQEVDSGHRKKKGKEKQTLFTLGTFPS